MSGHAVGAVVGGGDERFLRALLLGDEREEVMRSDQRLIAEEQEHRVGGSGRVQEMENAGAKGGAHAARPIRIFKDVDGEIGEGGSNFI